MQATRGLAPALRVIATEAAPTQGPWQLPPEKHKGDPRVAFAVDNDRNRYFFLRT